MKRQREIDIIVSRLELAGMQISPDVIRAVAIGLKQIRREKYEERVRNKAAYARLGKIKEGGYLK